MKDLIYSIVSAALLGMLGYVGLQIKSFVEEKYEVHIKKETVETCVKAVEQLYHDLKGPEKLKRCKKNVIEMLNDKGISITELELDMFIEAAVAQLNFTRLWGDSSAD